MKTVQSAMLISVGGFAGLARRDELIEPTALGVVLCLDDGPYRAYLCPDRERVESLIAQFADALNDEAIMLIRKVMEEITDFPEHDPNEDLIELNGRTAQYLGAMMMLMSDVFETSSEVS